VAQDFALPVRRAILPALKADPNVVALIPAASIFGSSVPADRTFPFGRYEPATVTPFRASGLDSSQMTIKISAFTKALYSGSGTIIASAEDQAHKMAAAIADVLDGAALAIGNGYKARITWTGSICTMDGAEKDAWHASISFKVSVSA
jgi:hypothetical protein